MTIEISVGVKLEAAELEWQHNLDRVMGRHPVSKLQHIAQRKTFLQPILASNDMTGVQGEILRLKATLIHGGLATQGL